MIRRQMFGTANLMPEISIRACWLPAVFISHARFYLDRLAFELADDEFERIDLERLHFSWEGSLRRGEGHYYRVQGPELLIEYDNTANEANHVHTVWRRHSGDFGDDLLAAHYEASRHTVGRGVAQNG